MCQDFDASNFFYDYTRYVLNKGVKIAPRFVNFFDKDNLFWLEKRKKCKKNLQERKNGNTFAVSYNNSTLIKI